MTVTGREPESRCRERTKEAAGVCWPEARSSAERWSLVTKSGGQLRSSPAASEPHSQRAETLWPTRTW